MKTLTKELISRFLADEHGGWGWGWNSGGMPPGGPRPYLVHDTFTDTDDTALASHTPDVDSQGGGWTEATPARIWDIQSNRLRDQAQHTNAYIDAGDDNVDVTVNYTTPNSTGGNGGPCYRDDGAGTRMQVILNNSGDELQPWTFDGGLTEIADYSLGAGGVAANTAYELRVTVDSSNNHEVFIDGTSRITVSSESHGSGNTNVGLYDNVGAVDSFFDDFQVYAN